MARLITISERTPLEIATAEGPKKICRCGLSKTPPYCDGSETATEGEDEALVYVYDAKGKRKVVEQPEKTHAFGNAWKWVLPVAYVLIPVNIINTVIGYVKLPAKLLVKGKVPGVESSLLDKTPYGFLFPIILQVLAVVVITWLSFHPEYVHPAKLIERLDARISTTRKDRFLLWVRRLLALLALLVSAYFTYISAAILYAAFIGEEKVAWGVTIGFLAFGAAIVTGWYIAARRHFHHPS